MHDDRVRPQTTKCVELRELGPRDVVSAFSEMDDPRIIWRRCYETLLDGWTIPRRLVAARKSQPERMTPPETTDDVDRKTWIVMCDMQGVVVCNSGDAGKHILESTM